MWRRKSFAAFFLCLVMLGVPRGAAAQDDCGAHVCASAGTRLLSVSSQRSAMLNALLSSLTDSSINLSVADYQALASADLELDLLLAALKSDLQVVNYEDVLTADVTLQGVLQAAASALVTQDGQAAAAALNHLLLVTLPDETFSLADMLQVDLRGGALATSTLNVLDLVTGTASLFNHKNALTVENVTVGGAALGLGSLIKDVDIGVTVPVPPVFVCGPEGTSFHSASIRLRTRVRLVNINANLVNLAALNVISAGLVVGNLDLVVDVAPGTGVIQTIDAITSAVTVHATPGVVSIYLGTVSDDDLLARTSPIDPATDLGFATVAQLNVTLLNTPLSVVSVKARAFAVGDDSSPSDLVFGAPYPASLTATTQADFLSSLVTDLLSGLEIQVGLINGATSQAVNAIVSQVTNLLKGVGNVLATPLNSVASGLLNPLLDALGVGLGELDVSLCAPTVIPVDTPCDDGLFCTGNQKCDGMGQCTGGSSPCVDPSDACLTSACNEVADVCDVVFLGCMIDGCCFPQGRVPGTCLMCDPSQSIFDFVVDPNCTSETDPPVQNPPAGGGGDGEFPGDGGTMNPDDDPHGGGGTADAGIEITGDVKTGLAGGSVCSVSQTRKRADEGWLLLVLAALFVERSRRRTTRMGSR